MFKCKTCQNLLSSDNYYFNSKGGRNHACKDCIKKKNVESYNSSEEMRSMRKARVEKYKQEDPDYFIKNKQRGEKFYASTVGRAKTLFKSAQRRSVNYTEKVDFDYKWILKKLEAGICEVTGISFDFEKPHDTSKNPYAPSIDRIDSSKGYCKDNVRIVIWQYNLMKGEIPDDKLLELCRIIVKRADNLEGN